MTNNTGQGIRTVEVQAPETPTNKLIFGKAIINGIKTKYMYDTGANHTVISQELMKKLSDNSPATMTPYTGPKVTSCDKEVNPSGIVTIDNTIFAKNIAIRHARMLVVPNLCYEFILGLDLMNLIPEYLKRNSELIKAVEKFSQEIEELNQEKEKKLNAINIECSSPLIEDDGDTLIFPGFFDEPEKQVMPNTSQKVMPSTSLQVMPCTSQQAMSRTCHQEYENQPDDLNNEECCQIRTDISEKLNSISGDDNTVIQPTLNPNMQFSIKLIDPDQRPIKCKARPLPFNLKNKVKEAIDEQVRAGIIRPSTSEWASALHVVHKPNGKIRLTVDYKRINNLIESDPYPLPSIKDLYVHFSRKKYLSKFDLWKGYHQFITQHESVKITAFICEFGTYEYITMPMGIKTAPGCFQRGMNNILKPLIDQGKVSPYLDDILLGTDSIKEHIELVDQLIQILKENDIKVSIEKCKILQTNIDFLGHILSKGEIKNDPKRAECIRTMAQPTTIKELQRVLGIFGYQRDFVENYAAIAQPLYDIMNLKNVPKHLRKKNGAVNGKLVPIVWTQPAIESFEKLREIISSDLVIGTPDFEQPFELTTDASGHAYGAVLEQMRADKKIVVGYFSKSYTSTQNRYSTSEKELLAIIMSIEHYHTFLYGRKFTVWTDHQPLTFLINKKDPHKRLERWIMRLWMYDFVIKYKPGNENIVADALSRLGEDSPITDENKNCGEDYFDVLVAAISTEDTNEQSTDNGQIPISYDRCSAVLAYEPTSTNEDEYEIYNQTQNTDNDIVWIKDLIKKHADNRPDTSTFDNNIRGALFKEYTRLRLINNILYRETEDINGKKHLQFVLAKESLPGVMKLIHESVYGAHLGRKKTIVKATSRFYRPYLKNYINKYVKTCDMCQKIKILPTRKAELKYLLPSRTNQIIASDFAGPMQTTENGNKYIQIICDLAGKYIVLRAHKSKEMQNAVDMLVNDWCCTFGIPEQILTDGGKEYQNALWDSICELLDIERLKTTPYHPECDGQSERVVRTIKTCIRAYSEDNPNWDLYLTQLAYAYNCSVHDTTGFSPFQVMFGREPRLPIDLIFPNKTQLENPDRNEELTIKMADVRNTYELAFELDEFTQFKDFDVDSITYNEVSRYVKGLKNSMQECFEKLNHNKQVRMETAKIRHDRKIKKLQYELYDKVLVNHPKIKKGTSQGISPKYWGPFEIVGVNKNGVDYLIRQIGKPKGKIRQLHQNNLKQYFSRGIEHAEVVVSQSQNQSQSQPVIQNQPAIQSQSIIQSQPVNHNQQIDLNPDIVMPNIVDNVRTKRSYNKNPNCLRWKQASNEDSESSSDAESSINEVYQLPNSRYNLRRRR